MVVTLEKIASIFLIMALGFVAAKFKVFSTESDKQFSKFLTNICLPCMILSSITSRTLTDDTLKGTTDTLMFATAYFIAMAILSIILAKFVFRVPKHDLGAYILLFSTNNTGFMGFPISMALFGEDVFYLMVIFNIVLTIFCNSLGPVIINIGAKKEGVGLKKALWDFLNINTIASVVAIAMLFGRAHFPTIVMNCLETVGDVTVPLSLFLIGLKMAQSSFKRIFGNGKMLALTIIKAIPIPVIVFLIVNMLDITVDMKICFVLASVLPSAAMCTAIAEEQNRNSVLCAEFVSISTLISLFSITACATLLTKIFGL